MSARNILLFPDSGLKKICREVKTIDGLLQRVLTDITETLYGSTGVGLAAPQIGSFLRIIAVDVTRKSTSKGHGLTLLINPQIVKSEGQQTSREGCLSIPAFTANVTRAAWIRIEGLNPQGHPYSLETDGFEAVAFQHEIDHLDGILFLDRVTNVKTDLFRRKKF
jgi:peptide deformylase